MSRYNGGANQQPFQPYHGHDPSQAGWNYTGHNSNSRVAFYENDAGVKADYYYTTGTIKTSMDHPRQGPTQLFRRDLSDSQYNAVLNNPRTHTGQGYHRK
ncbi:hypothetical protein HYH03_003640 [Edaphochlamys debaryana]|uniref:Uncharacterized protein n=1 Tax=Edaphochlamys debaryana TaxID=47281 RepID=A0A835YCN4_9CHLO|nr:hypothetical protein HYH03_003640 [Edaphochlamys debaryana]|eukprot:KAG2498381.1 hypothetical protein HYH03_003640 [Edaphochlamys debaryana]